MTPRRGTANVPLYASDANSLFREDRAAGDSLLVVDEAVLRSPSDSHREVIHLVVFGFEVVDRTFRGFFDRLAGRPCRGFSGTESVCHGMHLHCGD